MWTMARKLSLTRVVLDLEQKLGDYDLGSVNRVITESVFTFLIGLIIPGATTITP